MRKILLIAALVIGLCLSPAVMGNCGDAVWTDTDVVTVTDDTGYASLGVEGVSFTFDPVSANLQPGEQLAVSWWIKNQGPCLLDVAVTAPVTGVPAGYLVVGFKPGWNFQMPSGQQKQVVLLVWMQPGAPDFTANESFTITVTFTSTALGTRWQDPSSYNY